MSYVDQGADFDVPPGESKRALPCSPYLQRRNRTIEEVLSERAARKTGTRQSASPRREATAGAGYAQQEGSTADLIVRAANLSDVGNVAKPEGGPIGHRVAHPPLSRPALPEQEPL